MAPKKRRFIPLANYELAERVAIKMEADPKQYPDTKAGEKRAISDAKNEMGL